MQIERLDFISIPSRDGERRGAFYGATLGLLHRRYAPY